jgi:hypothetical protein
VRPVPEAQGRTARTTQAGTAERNRVFAINGSVEWGAAMPCGTDRARAIGHHDRDDEQRDHPTRRARGSPLPFHWTAHDARPLPAAPVASGGGTHSSSAICEGLMPNIRRHTRAM